MIFTKVLPKLSIFSDTLYGFRQFLVTQDGIIKISDFFYAAINDRKFSFFLVDHGKVIDILNDMFPPPKLERCRIQGLHNAFFADFLSDH